MISLTSIRHSEGSDGYTGNQVRDNLLRWLSPPDPSINHNIACKAHHNGTAQWFLQGSIFDEWKSTGSFLWIHGKRALLLTFSVPRSHLIITRLYSGIRQKYTLVCPSSTCSTLLELTSSSSSSIIQNIIALRDAGRASMGFFYFDFRDVDKQKLHNLLPSLLIQLSSRSDSCCDILSRLYSAHDRGAREPSDCAMVESLKEMLVLDTQQPTYIIMDALDECPNSSTVPSPREEVLQFVDELVGLHLPNVHICVTSRPEPDIQTSLEPLTSRPVSLHDESGQQQDITDYVASFVHSDRKMRRWRVEDKNLVIKTLSEKADGM